MGRKKQIINKQSHVCETLVMNLCNVAEVEELSVPEFTEIKPSVFTFYLRFRSEYRQRKLNRYR